MPGGEAAAVCEGLNQAIAQGCAGQVQVLQGGEARQNRPHIVAVCELAHALQAEPAERWQPHQRMQRQWMQVVAIQGQACQLAEACTMPIEASRKVVGDRSHGLHWSSMESLMYPSSRQIAHSDKDFEAPSWAPCHLCSWSCAALHCTAQG